MPCVLGLDAGGTRTRAALVDREGSVIQYKESNGLDPTVGAMAPEHLRRQLSGYGALKAATLGLPYHGEIAKISAWQTGIATETLGSGAKVLNDVALAHRGAFAGQDGVMILAGTGSMAWAEGPNGTVRVGGFGDLYGDEGSAYWVGRQALTTASREIDGRAEASGFAEALCARMGITGASLIDWTYSQAASRQAIAALARHVSALGQDAEPLARSILMQAATELSLAGQTAARRAGLGQPFRWSFAGGVFADPIIRDTLTNEMRCPAEPARLPPLGGAVIDAAHRAGWSVTDDWISVLSQNLADQMTSDPDQPPFERKFDDVAN